MNDFFFFSGMFGFGFDSFCLIALVLWMTSHHHHSPLTTSTYLILWLSILFKVLGYTIDYICRRYGHHHLLIISSHVRVCLTDCLKYLHDFYVFGLGI